MATKEQIEKFESLHAQLGSPPTKTETRNFKKMNCAEAYEEVGLLIAKVKIHGLFRFTPAPGMATPRQLRRYETVARRAGTPVTVEDIERAKAMTSEALNRKTVGVMRDHQIRLDSLGVTPSDWRLERGFYDPDLLRQGQQDAAARRQKREEEFGVRERVRNIGNPKKSEKVHPYEKATGSAGR